MGRYLWHILIAICLAVLLAGWIVVPMGQTMPVREPIPENDPSLHELRTPVRLNPGTVVPGTGRPSASKGSWPWFRGPARDGVAEGFPIALSWPSSGPKELWRITLGEGHAGAAIHNGCVYVLDYDERRKEDVVRCLSLDDGEEIWGFSYGVHIKRNHGMSRTVPAVTDQCVVTLGPKCDVYCLDSVTGTLRWSMNLVARYGTKVPEWYAGQCPLVDGDRLILATGGKCLLTAIDVYTGKTIWETPNDDDWRMTHSSVLPVDFEGKRHYVWCGDGGVVGIDGETGAVLWKSTDWRIKVATIPTPVYVGGGRLLFTGGYNAGSMMTQIVRDGGRFELKELFRTKAADFSCEQQTPIVYNGLIYAVLPGGHLACMTPDGRVLWDEPSFNFGLGPFLIVSGRMLVLDDNPPVLYLLNVDSTGAKKLAEYRISEGYDAWAPIAFADGRVILRDATTMVCLDLR